MKGATKVQAREHKGVAMACDDAHMEHSEINVGGMYLSNVQTNNYVMGIT